MVCTKDSAILPKISLWPRLSCLGQTLIRIKTSGVIFFGSVATSGQGEGETFVTMGRRKVERTAQQARKQRRTAARAAAYYASESRQQPGDSSPASQARVEQESCSAPMPVESNEEGFDVPNGPGSEPEQENPTPAECQDQESQTSVHRLGRDLSKPEEFDWDLASSFASHPDIAKGLSEREKKAFLCFNSPIMTRSLWDEYIKPLVDATVADLVPGGHQTWELKSFKGIRTQLKTLAPGMEPVYIDACRNHCCVFNNPVAVRGEKCPHWCLPAQQKEQTVGKDRNLSFEEFTSCSTSR